jgi:GNAT superfamily N-acetyltransferase
MYVDRELVRRVESTAVEFCARLVEVLARMSPSNPAAAQECDGGQLIAFGAGRYVNRAMGIGFGGMPSADIVSAVESFYRARSLPASVEITPWVDADLVAALGAAGFRLERFRNVYAHALNSLPDNPTADIRPVDDANEQDRKAILAGDVSAEARRVSDEYCDAAGQLSNSSDFVACVDGQSVACGSITIVRGSAGLGGAATMPQHRGKGLQTALLAYRLRLAAKSGCDLALATAVPDGQSARNLERLGFQLLYTQTVLTQV